MITVKNCVGDVYKAWGAAISGVVDQNYSMDKSKVPRKFPYMRIYMMGNPGTRWDLMGNECATIPSFQVDTFTTGQRALEKAYDLDEVSHNLMTSLGFRRSYGPELVENVDSSITRMISRYSRVYTGYFPGPCEDFEM